jgi:nucleoside-diphosphate-sugar epimerase
MKRILVTGKNSYIGNAFEKTLNNYPEKYLIDKISLRDESWKDKDFSKYDVILHVAGIAHVSSSSKMKELYLKINRDLTIDIANKARTEGVRQFIFMSSMIIYGLDSRVGEEKIINLETPPSPVDFYGQSKLEADLELQKMISNKFKPVIVRTPLVYGPYCKGNFQRLIKLARISPIFPDIDNQRSMIFIDNLIEFIRLVIDGDKEGVFFPQNDEYVSTKDIIRLAAQHQNKKVYFVKWLNPILKLLKIQLINKIFGSKAYDQLLSNDLNYKLVNFKESIKKSIVG